MSLRVARPAVVAAMAMALSWMLADGASARWEERVEQQCTNRQVCRPVQKTQQDCHVQQVCQQQAQPTSRCQIQNQCQLVTQMVPVCQMVQQCFQGRCMPQQQCQNVPRQQQVCQPRQVCQQVMASTQKCVPQQRCQPKVVTTQECSSQPQCQNVVKRVWVPDPPQPPAAALRSQPIQPPPTVKPYQGPPPSVAAVRPPPVSGSPPIRDHQAYKKQLEEQLKTLQMQKQQQMPKQVGASQRLDDMRRQQAAQHKGNGHHGNRDPRDRRPWLERREALRAEIAAKRAQIAELKASGRSGGRLGGGLGAMPDPQGGEAQEQEDSSSKLAELQSLLEQLASTLNEQEEQDGDESGEQPGQAPSDEGEDGPEQPGQEEAGGQPETEPAATRPGGQWQSMPRARE